MTPARRRVALLLLVGGVAACWGATVLLLSVDDDPATTAARPSSVPGSLPEPVARPQVSAVPVVLPVPAALADSWLSMRAPPIPVPIELHLPTVDVHAQVLGAGVTARGEMDAPQGRAGDPIWERAFWYRGSAVPGETSTALIAGHASAPKGGPAVFARLDQLHPGDPVVVHDTRTGLDVTFAVIEVRSYSLDEARDPAVLARIYGTGPASGEWSQPSTDGVAYLTLITCSGTYRPTDGTHDRRLVAFAARVS